MFVCILTFVYLCTQIHNNAQIYTTMHNLQSVFKKEFKAVSKLIGDKVTWGDIIVAILFVAYVLILPGLIHKLET